MTQTKTFEFKFNMPGLLMMLGTNIYSEPQVCVREMIQNAYDSCTRRQIEDPTFNSPQIEVAFDRSQRALKIKDNGSGLTEAEIHEYLSTIGSGKTAELRQALEKQDRKTAERLIGQFGLGLLSAFSIAQRVEIVTRSHQAGNEGLRWECEGDVNYTVISEPDAEVGTVVTIYVQLKHLSILRDEELRRIIRTYADLLTIPIYLGSDHTPVNAMNAPWQRDAPNIEYFHYVSQRFDIPALEVIPLRIENDQVTVSGVLYVPKSSMISIGEYGDVDVYVRGMYIKGQERSLLPSWAKFVMGLVDTPSLTPTVSRDEIVRDGAYQQVREVLGEAILAHLEHLSITDPRQLNSIVVSHNTLIKAWAIESDEFFDRIADLVQFDTNIGKLTIPEYLRRTGGESAIYYFKEAGSGTQQKVLFGARNTAVIDASFGAEEAFLQKYATRRNITVRRLDAEDEFIFGEVSDPDGRWRALEGQYQHLHKIEAKVVRFKPVDLPAVLVSKAKDAEIGGLLDNLLGASEVSGQIRDLLQSLKQERESQSSDMVTQGTILYLNAENPVIQALRDIDQRSQVLHLALIVLYNNAVLFGQHAITAENAIKMCQSNNEAVALMIEKSLEAEALRVRLSEA